MATACSIRTRVGSAAKWLPGHRWVAELDGAVVGWAAATPTQLPGKP